MAALPRQARMSAFVSAVLPRHTPPANRLSILREVSSLSCPSCMRMLA